MTFPGTYTVQRFSECLSTTHSWGSDTYHNLCTLAQPYTVPWGGMDYFANSLLVGGASTVVLLLLTAVAIIPLVAYLEARGY